jgi:hypothetical protein
MIPLIMEFMKCSSDIERENRKSQKESPALIKRQTLAEQSNHSSGTAHKGQQSQTSPSISSEISLKAIEVMIPFIMEFINYISNTECEGQQTQKGRPALIERQNRAKIVEANYSSNIHIKVNRWLYIYETRQR